jgi:hypothetical protein
MLEVLSGATLAVGPKSSISEAPFATAIDIVTARQSVAAAVIGLG